MEEDIKILEEYLNKQDRKFVSKKRFLFLNAIENLLKEYRVKELQLHLLREETNSKIKELEEENKASKEAINTLTNKLEKVVDEK